MNVSLRSGLGDLNFGGNGIISCAGVNPSLCNANVLENALALAWNKPVAQINAQCNIGSVPGAGCPGYLMNIMQWLQGGNIVPSGGSFYWCGPGSGTWGGPIVSNCSPTPPSVVAASTAARAAAASPFLAAGSSGGRFSPTVPTVYSTQQPSTVALPSPAPPQPSVVNPSPPGQLTTTGSSSTSPNSTQSTANGTVASAGDLCSTVGGLVGSASCGFLPNVPNWLIVAGGLLAVMMFMKK